MSARRNAAYDTRYRHKLNMLWHGQKMMAAVLALAAAGLLLYLCGLRAAGIIAWLLSALVLLVLLILVGVELHQDRVLNELALKESAEKENSR